MRMRRVVRKSRQCSARQHQIVRGVCARSSVVPHTIPVGFSGTTLDTSGVQDRPAPATSSSSLIETGGQGSRSRVQGLGFRITIQDSGFRVQGSGFRIQGVCYGVQEVGEFSPRIYEALEEFGSIRPGTCARIRKRYNQGMGFMYTESRVQDLEFRVQGSGFGAQGQGLGFRIYGSGFRVQDLGFRVHGLGFIIY